MKAINNSSSCTVRNQLKFKTSSIIRQFIILLLSAWRKERKKHKVGHESDK